MIDIKTLREGDKLLLKATVAFIAYDGAVYVKINGDYDSRRAEPTEIADISCYSFTPGDRAIAPGSHPAEVIFANETVVLLKFDDGTYANFLARQVTRVAAVEEAPSVNAAYPIEPPAIAAE